MSEPLPTVPPDTGASQTEPDGMPEERNDHPPRLNPARRAARRKAQQELFATHPNKYVVYLDVWTGDSVERRALVVAETLAECHRLMDELPAETRERATVTHVPPADSFAVPTTTIS
jgi:hypothetical protein